MIDRHFYCEIYENYKGLATIQDFIAHWGIKNEEIVTVWKFDSVWRLEGLIIKFRHWIKISNIFHLLIIHRWGCCKVPNNRQPYRTLICLLNKKGNVWISERKPGPNMPMLILYPNHIRTSAILSCLWWFWFEYKFSNIHHFFIFYRSVSCKILDNSWTFIIFTSLTINIAVYHFHSVYISQN